jgi:hypothetical protein
MDSRETPNDDDPIARFDLAHASLAQTQRLLFDAIRACDRAQVWRADGCRDMAQWVSGRLGISNWTARRWVAAAHALEDLPRLATALETAVLGVDKVAELARFATVESEQDLIRWARRASLAAVRAKADLSVRPDVDEVRAIDRARRLRGWWYDDGRCFGLEGFFPADQGALIEKALDRLGHQVPESPEGLTYEDGTPVDHETRADVRRADALYLMASQAVQADSDPDRATMVVHAPLEVFLGADRSCASEDGPVIHPEVAARLCCDARLQVVLHDGTGHAVGIGHAARNIPRWLMRALRQRDKSCCFPGCDFRRFLHGHHIVPWPQGPTDLHNLLLVCPFHHKLVHEYGWRVELADPGTATWLRPDGRRYDPSGETLDRAPPLPRSA